MAIQKVENYYQTTFSQEILKYIKWVFLCIVQKLAKGFFQWNIFCLFTKTEYPQQKFKGNCSKALLATRRSPSSGHFKSYEIKQREDNDAIEVESVCGELY